LIDDVRDAIDQDLHMSDDGPFSVVLADAHVCYREGLAGAISACRELTLIGVVGDGEAAFDLIESCRPDIALVDIRLPGSGGLVVTHELMKGEPPLLTRVVIASTFSDRPMRVLDKAESAGAVGYLGKDASRQQICEALIAAGRGQSWISLDPAVGMIFSPPSGPVAGLAA
jgi:DNA-binding NarL/FixJ family response regulator